MPDTSYIFIVHNFSKVHKNVSCMFDLIRSLTNLNKNTYHRDSAERLNKMMHIFKQKRRYSMRKEKIDYSFNNNLSLWRHFER